MAASWALTLDEREGEGQGAVPHSLVPTPPRRTVHAGQGDCQRVAVQGLFQQPPAALIVTLAMAISAPGDGRQGGRPFVPHTGQIIAYKSQVWDSCGSN
jgi:hypothetical protein